MEKIILVPDALATLGIAVLKVRTICQAQYL